MENPCHVLLFGDSITKGYAQRLEDVLNKEYSEIELKLINAGISGETSRDGIGRLDDLSEFKPNVVIIGFGMNDWRKGIDKKEFKNNLLLMLEKFESIGTRVIINTLSPSYNRKKRKYNKETEEYSDIVREIAYEKRIKIADIEEYWKRELKKKKIGLRDEIHPNPLGYEIICNSIMQILPRRNTTVLWQFNGREAKCNYRCPYCYYLGLHNIEDRFTGYIEQWRERFKEAFGNQHVVFYLAFGEPSIGKNFPEILEMVDNEPNWELRMTSNVSSDLSLFKSSKAVKEGRFNVNASYHPSMTNRDDFLNKLLELREYGIEASIVYVAYPQYIGHLENDILFFAENGFVVHLRRFQGYYKNKLYPWAYNDTERILIARYSDDGMIKYMLNQQLSKGGQTYAGVHFFVVDNAGNVGYDANAFKPYTQLRNIFGNINTGNFRPLLLPGEYPGFREGTVDGVSNLKSANYKELEHNNVLSFSKQGGVYKDENGKVIYSNKDKDFNNPRIRAEYSFPPIKFKDYIAVLRFSKLGELRQFIYTKTYIIAKKIVHGNPKLKKIIKKTIKGN